MRLIDSSTRISQSIRNAAIRAQKNPDNPTDQYIFSTLNTVTNNPRDLPEIHPRKLQDVNLITIKTHKPNTIKQIKQHIITTVISKAPPLEFFEALNDHQISKIKHKQANPLTKINVECTRKSLITSIASLELARCSCRLFAPNITISLSIAVIAKICEIDPSIMHGNAKIDVNKLQAYLLLLTNFNSKQQKHIIKYAKKMIGAPIEMQFSGVKSWATISNRKYGINLHTKRIKPELTPQLIEMINCRAQIKRLILIKSGNNLHRIICEILNKYDENMENEGSSAKSFFSFKEFIGCHRANKVATKKIKNNLLPICEDFSEKMHANEGKEFFSVGKNKFLRLASNSSLANKVHKSDGSPYMGTVNAWQVNQTKDRHLGRRNFAGAYFGYNSLNSVKEDDMPVEIYPTSDHTRSPPTFRQAKHYAPADKYIEYILRPSSEQAVINKSSVKNPRQVIIVQMRLLDALTEEKKFQEDYATLAASIGNYQRNHPKLKITSIGNHVPMRKIDHNFLRHKSLTDHNSNYSIIKVTIFEIIKTEISFLENPDLKKKLLSLNTCIMQCLSSPMNPAKAALATACLNVLSQQLDNVDIYTITGCKSAKDRTTGFLATTAALEAVVMDALISDDNLLIENLINIVSNGKINSREMTLEQTQIFVNNFHASIFYIANYENSGVATNINLVKIMKILEDFRGLPNFSDYYSACHPGN